MQSPKTRTECLGRPKHKQIELDSGKGHDQSRGRVSVKSCEDLPAGKVVPRINNKIQIVYNLVEIKSLLILDSIVLNLQNEIIKRAKDH